MAKKETKRLSLRAAVRALARSGIDEIVKDLSGKNEIEFDAFFDIVKKLKPAEWGGGVTERIEAAEATMASAIGRLPDGPLPKTEVTWKDAANVLYRFTLIDDELAMRAYEHAVKLRIKWKERRPAHTHESARRVAVIRLWAGEKATLCSNKRDVERITETLYNELAKTLKALILPPSGKAGSDRTSQATSSKRPSDQQPSNTPALDAEPESESEKSGEYHNFWAPADGIPPEESKDSNQGPASTPGFTAPTFELPETPPDWDDLDEEPEPREYAKAPEVKVPSSWPEGKPMDADSLGFGRTIYGPEYDTASFLERARIRRELKRRQKESSRRWLAEQRRLERLLETYESTTPSILASADEATYKALVEHFAETYKSQMNRHGSAVLSGNMREQHEAILCAQEAEIFFHEQEYSRVSATGTNYANLTEALQRIEPQREWLDGMVRHNADHRWRSGNPIFMRTQGVWIKGGEYVELTGPEDPAKQYLDAPTYLKEARMRARTLFAQQGV